MKKIICKSLLSFWLAVTAVVCCAGPKVDSYLGDLSRLEQEQAKQPKLILKFGDSQGDLVKAVLSPERVKEALDEFSVEIDQADSFKAFLNRLTPVTKNYAAAFQQIPGGYDQEYLKSFEITYMVVLSASDKARKAFELAKKQDANIDPDLQKMVDASMQVMTKVPLLLLKELEVSINNGKFSDAYAADARALYEKLKPAVEYRKVSNDQSI